LTSPLETITSCYPEYAIPNSNHIPDGTSLLVDDVYTTGGTSHECIRVLKSSGAGEVRVMALAKDQRTFARKTCSACGRSMKIRTNPATTVKFWGCSGYPDHCRNTEDI
jgi:hypoxanthine phosphoribosyltransferase